MVLWTSWKFWNCNYCLYIFNETYFKYLDLIKEDQTCFFIGKDFNNSENETITRMIVNRVYPLEGIKQKLVKNINISLSYDINQKEILDQLETLHSDNQGSVALILHLRDNNDFTQRILINSLKFNIEKETMKKLRSIFGYKNVWVSI